MPSLYRVLIQIALVILVYTPGFSQLTISNVNPLIVERFDTVSITGTGLSGVTGVFFGNQLAKSFFTETDTLLKAVINHGAAGKVKVKTANSEAFSSESLLVSYNSDLLFVGSFNEDSLKVIHPGDGKVIGKIRLPRTVEYFRIHPNNKIGYAADPVKDSLYEISLTEWRVLRQIKVDDLTAIEYNPVNRTVMVTRVNTTVGVNITINGLNEETLSTESEIIYASTINHPNFGSPVTNDKFYFNPADSILWFARNVSTGTYIFNARIGIQTPRLISRHFNTTENPKQLYGFAMLQNKLFTLSYVLNNWLSANYKRILEFDSIGRLTPQYDFLNAGAVNGLAFSPTLKRLYCADSDKNRIYIVDPFSSAKLRKTLNVGQLPSAIGISPKLNVGYTLNRTDASITIINLATEIVSKSVSPGFQPKNYEGSFVANYDANYKGPEIQNLSTLVAQPDDTVNVFGKGLHYIENIIIGKTKVNWFEINNDSTIRMAIPKSTTGLLTFITKVNDIPFDTFRICTPDWYLEHNGYSNQLICTGEPFTFYITKNPISDPNNINWLVNGEIKATGPYFSSTFTNPDTVTAMLTTDTGNCRGYNFLSNRSIINLHDDTLSYATIPYYYGKNQSIEINTSTLSQVKQFNFPTSYTSYDTLTFGSVIDPKNNYLYIIGPKTSSLFKYNYRTRKLELSTQINLSNWLEVDEIVLGNDGKFLYCNLGNKLLIYKTDSLKLYNTIDFGSTGFSNLKNDGNRIRVSKLINSGGLKVQHVLIDTSTQLVVENYVFNGISYFAGYSDNSFYRYDYSNTQIFETDLNDSTLNQANTVAIGNISFIKNIDRIVVFSDHYTRTSKNSGIFNFENGSVQTFPYIIRDAVNISPGRFAIITEVDYNIFHFKIIDFHSLKTIDSIPLPNFYGWYGEFASPFMQSYTLTRPPCSNKIKLCNGLPNNGMVIEKLAGSSYKWQLSTDGGLSFNNLENGPNYSGTNTRQLNLLNLPDTMSGFQYRCLVDGFSGEPYLLAFENTWKPMQTGNWEDPANWSCGLLPGPTTDVIIFSGSVKLNSDITIRSLQIMPGVQFELAPGVQIHLNKP